jgi:hypothetical protein
MTGVAAERGLLAAQQVRGRVKTVVRAGALFGLALCLVLDATSSMLVGPDPVPGRQMGCYTAVDLLLGATRPGIGRGIELLLCLGCIRASIVVLWRARPRPKCGLKAST